MKPTGSFDRRYFMKLAGAAPLLAYVTAQGLAEKAWGAVGKSAAQGDIYSTIGVRSFINGRGTWTYLSGSLELPEVRSAKQAAAQHFVDIFELQHAASKRLAQLSGAEAGMVTSGAAGAMASATAACIAGNDPASSKRAIRNRSSCPAEYPNARTSCRLSLSPSRSQSAALVAPTAAPARSTMASYTWSDVTAFAIADVTLTVRSTSPCFEPGSASEGGR